MWIEFNETFFKVHFQIKLNQENLKIIEKVDDKWID